MFLQGKFAVVVAWLHSIQPSSGEQANSIGNQLLSPLRDFGFRLLPLLFLSGHAGQDHDNQTDEGEEKSHDPSPFKQPPAHQQLV